MPPKEDSHTVGTHLAFLLLAPSEAAILGLGTEGKPTMILVHGGLDHARNWDWVARALRDDFHVYAIDLRGHGNSAWAPGALYSIAEHVLDLSALADVIDDYPVYLIGHSLGGIITLYYSGVYPDR